MRNWRPVFLAVAVLAALLAFSGIEAAVATGFCIVFSGLFLASLVKHRKHV